jgi:hypothetical protein
MRLAPVAIRHWREPEQQRDVAARQSRTTHAAPEAVDARNFGSLLPSPSRRHAGQATVLRACLEGAYAALGMKWDFERSDGNGAQGIA